MKRAFVALLAFALVAATTAARPEARWTQPQVERLIQWIAVAADDGLASAVADMPALRAAMASGNPDMTDRVATASAARLLTAFREGCCNAALKKAWHIEQGQPWPEAASAVAQAVAEDRLDALFSEARPSHPFYRALQTAYAKERDAARRATLAANLDRWRWMPRDLGQRYLLVNAAAFEATLWQEERIIGRWSVIVGKAGSPTPVFKARVTGVTFNPWWEIPSSIAKESVAGLVARDPAGAARKGYIREGNRYRQRPGPDNALGQMKLVMPNRFNVYLHDTPARSLFTQAERTYSHGCIRVGNALGLATTLLSTSGSWTRQDTDAVVTSKQTRTVSLSTPIPVYITYFTAEPGDTGGIRYFKDVYRRDAGASAPRDDGTCL